MADEGKKPEVKADAHRHGGFIGRAVHDPANPQPLMRLTGYRGASSEAAHVRLYLDAEISSYIDIPEADVVYEQPVPTDTDPLGSVTLWVKRDAKLNFKTTRGGQQAMYGQYGYPGGQAGMEAGMGMGAAAPQNTITTGFSPVTQTQTGGGFTFPPSPFQTFCPPPSLYPGLCTISPIPQHCTISPVPVHCTVSPFPPHCTVSPFPPHCTVSPLPLHCTQSPFILFCTVHSLQVVQCTQVTPASPNCTPGTPVSPISPGGTPVSTIQGGGEAAFGAQFGGAGFGAAPQAITQTHLTVTTGVSPLPFCHQSPLPWLCHSPYPFWCPPPTPQCTISHFPTPWQLCTA